MLGSLAGWEPSTLKSRTDFLLLSSLAKYTVEKIPPDAKENPNREK